LIKGDDSSHAGLIQVTVIDVCSLCSICTEFGRAGSWPENRFVAVAKDKNYTI
jgi:hypothetical protein